MVLFGCGGSRSSIPSDTSVTDITPTPEPVATTPQPVHTQQPVISDSMETTGAYGALGAGPYVVKKGDTLYSIAKSRFGEGKQWQRIAAANPGLEPSKLKVGQTITLP
jgi:5'-nucleotidase